MSDPAIAVADLDKHFGRTQVLHSLHLEIERGRTTAVLGGSGAGKTTLLRVLAGFDHADEGTVSIAGRVVDGGGRFVRPQHRGVGYVPQDASLFPHLTVAANVGFGVPRRSRQGLAALIDLVGLTGFERRYPHELSGGQQQRVALARALAIEPKVVLLDEPFGSLDAGLRESVRADVMRILADTGTTTVLVTHDQHEAMSVADRIALLDGGRIVVHDTPRQLYDHPPTPEIAAAIGTANLLPGELGGGQVRCLLGTLPLDEHLVATSSPTCTVLLRPEQLVLSERTGSATAGSPDPALPATVTRVRYMGHDALVDLRPDAIDGLELFARVVGSADVEAGQRVLVSAVGPCHVWV